MDGHGRNTHWKVPCWQTLQRQQSSSDSASTCSHLVQGHFFSYLMASFCPEPWVYSRQKSGRWIVKGWITAHSAIRLSSTSTSLAMAWRRIGRMGEWLRSLGECFLSPAMNGLKQRESKSHTRARSVFQACFMSCDSRELWISGGHFYCSDNLRSHRFQARTWLWKISNTVGNLS